MPVGRVSGRREIGAVVLALGGIAVAVLALVGLLRLAHKGDVEVHLGSDTFQAGQVGRMAKLIASEGPFLYPDVSGGTRDLYLNHLGPTPDTGWVAFAARSPGSARECYVRWQPDAGHFLDSCSGATYPADGSGLEQFPVTVQGGELDVDINHTAERRAQQQQDRSTTSSVVESGIPRSATSIPAPATTPSSTPSVTAPSRSDPTSSASSSPGR